MTIQTGQKVPDVTLRTMGSQGPEEVSSGEVLGDGKVVLFAVPGAFTPGCSNVHLPGFLDNAEELHRRGADRIACVAVNDPFVMAAWGDAYGVGDTITLLSDGNGDFAEAMGLVLDGTGMGLGKRSKRYAAILQDGVVTSLDVDEKGVENSACSNLMPKL